MSYGLDILKFLIDPCDSFLVSNEERFLNCYKPFLERYDECMSGYFSSIGEDTLPSKYLCSHHG